MRRATRAQRGFTLIELFITMTVLAIVLTIAVPSLHRLVERERLRGSADLLRTDLQYLRSASISRHQDLRFETQTLDDGGSCYLIHTGNEGDCRCTPSGHAVCIAGVETLRVVAFDGHSAVQLGLASKGKSLLVDPMRGTVTPTATIALSSRSGDTVQQTISVLGRVRSCSPGGQLSGYAECSAS